MGRELRRVPLDFDWPLKKVWFGFVNPHYRECPAAAQNQCSGGTNPSGMWLDAISRLIAMVGEHAAQEAHQDNLRERGWTWPHPYLQEWQQAPRTEWPRDVIERMRAITDTAEKNREMHRYHLANPPRLLSFGPELVALVNGLSGGQELSAFNSCRISYEIRKKLLASAGLDNETFGRCAVCNGEGIDPAAKEAYEAWESTPPPDGEGWQLWETVSEGSPVSPVFATRDAFVDFLVDEGWSRDGAEHFADVGWAPSAIAVVGTNQ
jgi:hypothetical protein